MDNGKWSPKKFNERQMRALDYVARNFSVPAVAIMTGYSRDHIYKLIATSEASEMVKRLRDERKRDELRQMIREELESISV